MNTVVNNPAPNPTMIVVADVASTFEKFTKKQAQSLLDNQSQNRNPRPNKVNEYRDQMNAGKWIGRCKTALPIIFDRNGRLAGGQHRMLAFVKSELDEIEFPVVRDVSVEELPYQDANIARTTRDRVNMFEKLPLLRNISNTTTIAALKIVMDYKNDVAGSKLNTSDPESIAKVGKEYEAILLELDAFLNKKSIVIKHASMIAAFAIAKSKMTAATWEFCLTKTSNFENLHNNDPMYRFRELVEDLPKGFSNADRWTVFLKTLYCLRAQQKDQKVDRVLGQKSVLDSQTWK